MSDGKWNINGSKMTKRGRDDIQVVANVSVANMMEHSIQNSVVTVHCCKRTAKVVPFVATVVRQLDV